MSTFTFLFVITFFALVSSENVKQDSRQSRIFTFNTENEDIEVGLDFSIPFLKIPLKKTFNAVTQFGFPGIHLPKINVNPSALAIGGMLIVTTIILSPFFSKFGWHHFDRSSRGVLDIENNETAQYIIELLATSARGCPERIACWTSRKTKNPENAKTWKQIMSNKLLSSMVNTTTLEIATRNGRKGQNCEAYSPCPLDEETLPKIINNFVILFKSKSK